MADKESLFEKLGKYEEVIIYGYMDIGTCVLDYIIEFGTNIKGSSYDGKVKYFAHSSLQERQSIRVEKKGIPIRSIYQLKDYADTALVIIATQEQHHDDITWTLDELHFRHRFYITYDKYCVLREAVENRKGIVDNRIMQYQLNHQIKLDRLRTKIKAGGKAKVFFMVHDAAVFGYASVYRAMEKDPLFEPYIFAISRRDTVDAMFYEEALNSMAFFQKNGYRVINAYDALHNPVDLHRFKPDILFYDLPKLYGATSDSCFRLDQLNWEFLTCYVPYGLLMVDSFFYHYHTTCIRETWRFFLDTSASFKRVLSDGEFSGFNTVFSGYPKLDDYHLQEDKYLLPEKLQNDNRTIIYAPHHTLGVTNNFGTFDLYKDIFMELLKNHPDINFVYKPHPLLARRIKSRYIQHKSEFSYDDYLEYMREWDAMPNGLCITEGDYIKIFKCSNCMITDCGSFIGEYFPSLNPCIYLFNPRKKRQEDVYTPLAKEILNTYYICKTREELYYYIEEVAINGVDSKKAERETLFREEFQNIGNAGSFICEHIKGQLTV